MKVKDLFTTRFKIMPVYDENGKEESGVVLLQKSNFLCIWNPARKRCTTENGNITLTDAVFKDEEEAKRYIAKFRRILDGKCVWPERHAEVQCEEKKRKTIKFF